MIFVDAQAGQNLNIRKSTMLIEKRQAQAI
jgi:hypothetical protein